MTSLNQAFFASLYREDGENVFTLVSPDINDHKQ
jgi:hypothetical protein